MEAPALACHLLTEFATAHTHWTVRPLAEAVTTWSSSAVRPSEGTVARMAEASGSGRIDSRGGCAVHKEVSDSLKYQPLLLNVQLGVRRQREHLIGAPLCRREIALLEPEVVIGLLQM